MHSDREKLVERLRHRAETMNGAHPVGAGDGGTYAWGYYTVADQKLDREAIAALSEPVKAEPAAWQHRWRVTKPTTAWTEWSQGRLSDSAKRQIAAGYIDAEERPLYTRPAGERPAVAVEADRAKDDQYWSVVEQRTNLEDDNARLREALNAARQVIASLIASEHNVETWDLKRRLSAIDAALAAEPQAVPEGLVLVPRADLTALLCTYAANNSTIATAEYMRLKTLAAVQGGRDG